MDGRRVWADAGGGVDAPRTIHGQTKQFARIGPNVWSGAVGRGRSYTDRVSASCEQNPFGLLVELADRLRAFLDDAAAAEGLTAQQAQVLLHVDEPVHMSALAERNLCDPSSVTAMVKRLERGGHVQRAVDPADRRARLVRLTPKGRRTRDRLEARLAQADSVIADLDGQQRAALAGLFARDRAPT